MRVIPRLKREQLEIIKKKKGVDNLWSYSKASTFKQCTWLYFLKYVEKIRVKEDSCYTHFGSIAHDIIQGFYDGESNYSEMIDRFNEEVIKWEIEDSPSLKFPSDNVRDGYIENLRHYFLNVHTVPFNVTNEEPILVTFEGKDKYVFQGYLDSEYIDDDGNLVILDYKTSSINGFSGKNLLGKAEQLMTYALGVIQNGRLFDGEMKKFTVDKIKIRYDMMKYCNITFVQKNGKKKTMKAERRSWVGHLSNQLRKDLEDVSKQIEKLEKEISKLNRKANMKKTTPEEAEEYMIEIGGIESDINNLKQYDMDVVEINELISNSCDRNTLELFPQFIQDKYTIDNCYIDVSLTDEDIEEFKSKMITRLDNIIEKSEEEDKEKAFDRPRIDNSDSFYCTNLCDMKDHCKFYKEYKEHNAMFLDKKNTPSDEDLLAMLGLS